MVKAFTKLISLSIVATLFSLNSIAKAENIFDETMNSYEVNNFINGPVCLQELPKPKKHYDILSIDGGGLRGIIPAVVLNYFEDYAYSYARNMSYIPENPKKKVPIKDLFDMVSGSSTGSYLAIGLTIPS